MIRPVVQLLVAAHAKAIRKNRVIRFIKCSLGALEPQGQTNSINAQGDPETSAAGAGVGITRDGWPEAVSGKVGAMNNEPSIVAAWGWTWRVLLCFAVVAVIGWLFYRAGQVQREARRRGRFTPQTGRALKVGPREH